MTQFNITLDLEEIKAMLQESELNSILKSSITLILNQLMETERDDYMQSERYERLDERATYRNGYYERELLTNVGTIQLRVPRTRDGEFSTSIFEKYQRCDQAMVLSMIEMVVNGVSTRKVTKIVEQLCGTEVSKSLVSDLVKRLDPQINDWRQRPLQGTYYPYIYTDAMYVKVREHHRVVSKAVLIALGIKEDGHREFLGIDVSHNESKETWSTFFTGLTSRGLSSPKLVISDSHAGLVQAVQTCFVGTSWQRCCVHLQRNIIDKLPKTDSLEARTRLRSMFRMPSLELSRKAKDELLELFGESKKYAAGLAILENGFDDATQFYEHHQDYHVSLRTTNVLERVNREVRRRQRVIQIFPNHQSAIRLISAVLMSIEQNWIEAGVPLLRKQK